MDRTQRVARRADRWVDFYRPYFPTPGDAQNFVAACREGEAGEAACEIMQHSRRLILLADAVAGVRPGRDALPLFFLIVCAEHASKRVDGAGKGSSGHHVRNFFATYLTDAERSQLASAFTATDGSPVDAAGAVRVMYGVRNEVAHEGVYWNFEFSRPGARKGKAAVHASLTREEFRAIVVRGCIRAAMQRLKQAPHQVAVTSIVAPAEHDGQQRDWAEQLRLHRDYLRRLFDPQCPGTEFSNTEWKVLREQGSWLKALADKAIQPLTEAQRRFVDAADGRRPPSGLYEEVWESYTWKAAYFRVAGPVHPWEHGMDDGRDGELYDGTIEDYADYDAESDLIADELDEYAESWADADDEGWFYDDD